MRAIFLSILLAGLAGLLATSCDQGESGDGKYRVAFVYPGPVGDAGWTWSHDRGRLAVEKAFPDVATEYAELVPDGEAEAKIEQFASRGAKVVFTASESFNDQTLAVAGRHPEVLFVNCAGSKRSKNCGTYFGRVEEAKYLAGLVAGKMTRTGRIGYVAPLKIAEIYRLISAFTIGVREANPTAEVHVVWTNEWHNPSLEKDAANSLIDVQKADVILTDCDSAAPLQAADQKGCWAIGYNSDTRALAPKAFLTAATWDWSVIYVDFVRRAKAGEMKDLSAYDPYLGLESGLVQLAPLSEHVTPEAKALVEKRRQDLDAKTYRIFAGPIVDNQGNVRVPEGKVATDEEILTMRWLVQGARD